VPAAKDGQNQDPSEEPEPGEPESDDTSPLEYAITADRRAIR
jgi:hypothetical protein